MSLTSADKVMEPELFYEDGALVSMNPPETMFGFSYHAHMIPPFCPDNILFLGSGKETVRMLIEKVWDKRFDFRNVDIKLDSPHFPNDARKFVESCNKSVDYIVVDLWLGSKVCEFIYDEEFISNLRKISTNMISINIPIADREKAFKAYTRKYKYLRHDQVEGNAVMFFGCK